MVILRRFLYLFALSFLSFGLAFNYYVVQQENEVSYAKLFVAQPAKFAPDSPDGLCNFFVKNFHLSWSPMHWNTVCVSKLLNPDKNAVILGEMVSGNRTMYISSKTSTTDLLWVIAHENGHAADWVNRPDLNKVRQLIQKSTYRGSQSEAIADFQAFCATKATSWSSVYHDVSCSQIKQVFPWVTIGDADRFYKQKVFGPVTPPPAFRSFRDHLIDLFPNLCPECA